MGPGDVIADRFEIERLAGSGGMGAIYRAIDRRTGAAVAIKALRGDAVEHRTRFIREAALLGELGHPHIVRHVDHGVTGDDILYLAMEWLDGVDLQRRLRKGPLDERDTRTIARAAAEALVHAHALGIVHRDLKPGNLFLVGGDPARLKLVDFGVAHAIDRTAITRAGGVVGTPGYMAPEQVRGEGTIDPRCDVFSLGCVLYEALAGRPAFAARDALALLFKVLVEDPPPLRSLRDELTPELAGLVGRMLAKAPDRRPATAAAIIQELAAVPDAMPAEPAPAPVATGLTDGEQRLICVILSAGTSVDSRAEAATIVDRDDGDRRTRVRAVVARHGAAVQWLPDGGMIVVLRGAASSVTDQVALAARCALAIQTELPGVPLAIGTGRAELRAALPVGPMVDRAVELLRGGGPDASSITVDDVTARLLEQRFEIAEGQLIAQRVAPSPQRTLLGRPSPCVGRDRELAQLHALLDGCIEDRRSGAALVTAAAGIGKSRLVHEFVETVRTRHPDAAIWSASGDPMTGGAPLGLVAQAVAGLAMPRTLAEADRGDVEVLFAELVGGGDGGTIATGVSRIDPSLRAERIRRGFVALVTAECAIRPVVVVLEDLHWADGASLRFFDAALAEASCAPLLVVGLARPELRDRFPRLWATRNLDELRLPALRPGAASALARRALGAEVDDAMVARVVARADGNPFYLEELVRTVAEGRGDSLPETVLAMASARLDALEPAARQLLRAGSIFGEVFADADLAALIEGTSPPDRQAWLAQLVDGEVIVRERRDDAGPAVYRFRHAYLRDAAYAMLTDADRRLGHRLAAEVLERGGGTEPAVLADHYERADDARAAVHYLAAAKRAQRRSDPVRAIELSVRGQGSAGAEAATVDELRRVEARAHSWRGDFTALDRLSDAMLASVAPGSKAWWNAAVTSLHAAIWSANPARLERRLRSFVDTVPAPDAFAAYGQALGGALPALINACAHQASEPLYQRFVQGATPMAGRDPFVRAMLVWLASSRALTFLDDPWESLRLARSAIPMFEEAGDPQRSLHMQGEVAMALGEVGDFAGHEAENLRVFGLTSHMGLGPTLGLSFLAYNLAELGHPERGRDGVAWALERGIERGFSTGEGTARAALSAILLTEGRFDDAEREARLAVRRMITTPRYAALGLTALVRARLGQGRAAAALRTARAALAYVTRPGVIGPTDAGVWLVHAEALHAVGDVAAARTAIAAARDRVLARAARCPDPAGRALYLEQVPVVAATLARAAAWLG